jgi:hypothetical protein
MSSSDKGATGSTKVRTGEVNLVPEREPVVELTTEEEERQARIREKDAKRMREKRKDPDFRQKENQQRKERRQADPQYRLKEREHDRARKAERRKLNTSSNDSETRSASSSLKKKAPKIFNQYLSDVQELKETIPNWNNLYLVPDEMERIQQMIRVEVVGGALSAQYAWAIPDERALRICKEFSPLIEMGAGKGYWANLLKLRGCDIVCYDNEAWRGDKNKFTNVKKGNPKHLTLPKNGNNTRNLFLCYPDDRDKLAMKCLKYFTGEYIVHVGELMSTGTLSMPQSPWGRTTTSDFQVALAEEFHCILQCSIPSYPFAKDCISVWKRTTFVSGDKGQGDDDAGDNMWASIPESERLPVDAAAPCMTHLLERPPASSD